MFSTPTTASSTSAPMAIARPPSVMVLIDRSKALKTSAVIRTDTGMAVSEISVARTFMRKSIRTTATTIAASTSTRLTLSIEVSMKVACLNWTLLAVTPFVFGSFSRCSWMIFSCFSISSVRVIVSAVGCFWIPMMTAGPPM